MSLMTPTEIHLFKELKAARCAIRKLKGHFNEFDEGYALSRAALKRTNKVSAQYRPPAAPVTAHSKV